MSLQPSTSPVSARESYHTGLSCLSALKVAVAASTLQLPAHAADLYFNGGTNTVAGGTYNQITLVSNATVTINGNVTATNVLVAGAGCSLTVNGAVAVGDFNVQGGSAVVTGGTNQVGDLNVAGTLKALGKWSCVNAHVAPGGSIKIYEISGAVPGSGQLAVSSQEIWIEAGGNIDGIGSGRDPRGEGNCWYRDSAGGGHASKGGCGYWDSSRGGNEGQPYGTVSSYSYDMGGGGGSNGGGGVFLKASGQLRIDGDILCDGGAAWSSVGGGAGGTILLHGGTVSISGTLSAKGANAVGGGGGGGGGSGGRIKINYEDPNLVIDMAKVFYQGGAAGGYLNTLPGGSGTFYRNHVAVAPVLTAPDIGEQVSSGRPICEFALTDLSGAQDGHADVLTPKIEMSRDNFLSIAYTFDQGADLAGWDRPMYYNGDAVRFTCPQTLADGTYQWRASVRDRTVSSLLSPTRSFSVLNQEFALSDLQITRTNGGFVASLDALNGVGPYQLYDAPTPLGPWQAVGEPVSEPHFSLAPTNYPQRFFRVTQPGLPALRADRICDAATTTIAAGVYDTLAVKNDGILNVSGATTRAVNVMLDSTSSQLNIGGHLVVDEVLIRAGKLTVAGNLTAARVVVDGASGTLDVTGNIDIGEILVKNGRIVSRGTNNVADSIGLSAGRLQALGEWSCPNVAITNASELTVYPVTAGVVGSGQLKFATSTFFLSTNSIVNGVGAGRDPRGEGNCWYRDSAGGGHASLGGCGYWDSSRGGNEGQPFGSATNYVYDMGGGGGSNGGAGVCLEASDSLRIDGNIYCTGGAAWSSVGGGAGGTILLKGMNLTINGTLSVHGADAVGGGGGGGGGSGGRIKLFYGQPALSINMSKVVLSGGAAGGYLNTRPGGAGTYYSEHITAW